MANTGMRMSELAYAIGQPLDEVQDAFFRGLALATGDDLWALIIAVVGAAQQPAQAAPED